jgi:anti-sigma-K factor RskA
VDVNEYIASGILEAYSIGAVSSQEKQEVECMCHIYPEIREELNKIMVAVEQMANVQKISPPAEVKTKLFAQIKNIRVEEPSTGKIVPLRPTNNYKSFNRVLAAACLILAISMVSLYFYETSNAVYLTKQLAKAEEVISDKQFKISKLEESKKYSDAEIAMFRDPNFKTVFLKSTNNKPENALAIVCCNTKNKSTVIAIQDLPSAPTDKEYQLWAIVNGKPVSLGMIPADSMTKGFFEVKNVENPQAFAITLEKVGGVEKPTMEEMFVIGTI